MLDKNIVIEALRRIDYDVELLNYYNRDRAPEEVKTLVEACGFKSLQALLREEEDEGE